MPEPPYDRALVLAAQVRTLRDHYLEVSCGCGDRRVIALARMAEHTALATATLAHVALTISCHGCHTGPDEVHLCATVYGRKPAEFGGADVWTMALVTRAKGGAYLRRRRG